MKRPEGLAVTVLLTALVAFGAISTDLYLPSLPSIVVAFDSTNAVVQLTLSVFLCGFAVSQIIYGPLSDRFGRRAVLIGGLAIYLAGSLACAAAPGVWWLVGARFVQSVGACAGVVLGRAIVRDIYGRERAAKALSYMGMAMALAPALGPIVGGYVEVWFGWRVNFLALVAFGASCLLGTILLLPETNRWRDPAATNARRMLGNYLVLAGDRVYLGYVLVNACAFSGIFAFISGSSFVFIDVLGLSPDRYGLCFGAIVVGYMVGTFASGRLTMGLGHDRLILTGAMIGVLGGAGAAGLALAGELSVAAIIAPIFLFMIGVGLMLPNAMAGAIGPYPQMAGAASALMGFIQMTLAAAVGIAIGHLHDGTAIPMTGAIAALAFAALFAYWVMLHRRDRRMAIS